MNLYLLSQSQERGYDTYDSCVVAAESEEIAKTIHPSGFVSSWGSSSRDWTKSPEHVDADLIGEAVPGTERGVICASFNAG